MSLTVKEVIDRGTKRLAYAAPERAAAMTRTVPSRALDFVASEVVWRT